MSDLSGQVGELRFTVSVVRGDTGKVENYELVGKIAEDQFKELIDGSHALDGGAQRSD
jgi:hypothetical protein